MKKTITGLALLLTGMLHADVHLYITDGAHMKIVDVTQPSHPVLQGDVVAESSYYVYTKEHKAYVGMFSNANPFLRVVDVNDPNQPSTTQDFPKGGALARVSDMTDKGTTLYISDEYRGIHKLDIGTMSLSTQIHGSGDTMSLAQDQNGHMLAILQTSGQQRLEKLDISNLNTPALLQENHIDIDASSYPMSDSSRHSWVRTDGAYVYVANTQDKKLKKFANNGLSLVASVSIGGYATAMDIDNGYAYITMHTPSTHPSLDTSADDGLKVVQLSSMTVVAHEALAQASGVVAKNNEIYVTDANGLHIFEMSGGSLSLVTDFSDGDGNYVAMIEDVNNTKPDDGKPDDNTSDDTNGTVIHTTPGGGCTQTKRSDASPDLAFLFLIGLAFLNPVRRIAREKRERDLW